MMGRQVFKKETPSELLRGTQRVHDEIVDIYSEQVRILHIRVAILEDENQKLKERLKQYEDPSV